MCSKVESASGRRSNHDDVARDGEARKLGTRPSRIEIESVSEVLRLYSETSSREATFPELHLFHLVIYGRKLL